MTDRPLPDVEPLPSELAAIDAEWPLIVAELAVLDREIARLTAHELLDQVQVRRAGRVTRARLRTATGPGLVERTKEAA
jgi:hypothetical protein